MESGARENQSVDEGDRNTDRNASAQRAQHTAGCGTVQVKRVATSPKIGGDDVGLVIRYKSDVADKSLIEDFINSVPVVGAALRQAFYLGTRRGCKCAHLVLSRSSRAVGARIIVPCWRSVQKSQSGSTLRVRQAI